MTTTRHIDWCSGAVRIEQVRIEVDASGALAPDARALCGRPEITPGGALRDLVGKPLGLHGYAARRVIDVADARVASVAVLFEPIHFFDGSITESRLVQAVAAASGWQLASTHPASAALEPLAWGRARFSHDRRQADPSLMLRYP
ncbi:hypothetical protein [Burkholderia gladioli]|uniref:hypothetical protein n=1 Tax=Burkholderia gladioli TaxID=28095 RepID=UPI00164091F8|nr:hypothetical protein [Burkholderia gladioli]